MINRTDDLVVITIERTVENSNSSIFNSLVFYKRDKISLAEVINERKIRKPVPGSLKRTCKSRGLKGISTLKKAALVERMLQEDEKEAQKAHAGEAEHDAEKNRKQTSIQRV